MHPRVKRVATALAALGAVACAAVGIWLAVTNLPAISAPPPAIGHGDPTVTWGGQGVGAAYGLGFVLLLIIYAAKPWIPRIASSVPETIAWYALGVACSLPYIWFLVVLDWQNPFVFRLACWVYCPLAFWVVPTVSFAWDVTRRRPLPWGVYFRRSFVEVVVVVPAWIILWLFASFFFLGGGWI